MKRKFALFYAFGFLYFANTFSQKLPDMYISTYEGKHRVAEFDNGAASKFKQLKLKLPNQDLSFIYSVKEIQKLISLAGHANGIRIYFAAYKAGCSYSLPTTIAKEKIVLLFSPGYKKRTASPEQFFFIDEKDNVDSVYEIPKSNLPCVNVWLNNYTSDNIQDSLRQTLEHNDPGNLDPTNHSRLYFDTKSIFYSNIHLREAFVIEPTYVHVLDDSPDTVKLDWCKISFAAFDRNGEPGTRKWRRRMLLNLNFMYDRGSGKVDFMFERLTDFDRRITQTLKRRAKYKKVNFAGWTTKRKVKAWEEKDLDNGQLCPTICNPR